MPIISWFDDKDDDELVKLIPLLKRLSFCSDVRNELYKFIHNDMIIWNNVDVYLEEIDLMTYSSSNSVNQYNNNRINSQIVYNNYLKNEKILVKKVEII